MPRPNHLFKRARSFSAIARIPDIRFSQRHCSLLPSTLTNRRRSRTELILGSHYVRDESNSAKARSVLSLHYILQ
jgi:hypothetical protein